MPSRSATDTPGAPCDPGASDVIRVFPDLPAAAAGLAARVASEAAAAIAARGAFRLGLSGGETPVALYRLLASPEWRRRVDWSRTVLLLADERAVPADAPERTDRLVRETLIEPLGAPAEVLRPMRAEAGDLESAAREYEAELGEPLDLLLLGAGPDGHIASLFPGRAAVDERVRRVVVVRDSPKPPPERLTVTPRVLAEARSVCVLAAGEGKAAAVAAALGGRATAEACPAVLVAERDWYLDRAAASRRT